MLVDVNDTNLLRTTLRDVGVAALVNHGVNTSIWRAVHSVFDAPISERSPFADQRGYIAQGGESGSSSLAEAKQGFSYGKDNNKWAPSADHVTLSRIYDELSSLSRRVLLAFPELRGCCENATALARLFHYLPGDGLGSAPHTDWGLLTLVLADDFMGHTSSLQVWESDEWRSLDVGADAIILNAGDYMALAAPVRSPRHRVVSHPSKHRHSLVFFYYPDYDAPLPQEDQDDLSLFECQAEEQASCAASLGARTFGDYIARKWDEVRR